MKVSTEKPGTPSELAHHGVPGMKWGRRSPRTIAFNKKYSTNQKRTDAILRARGNTEAQRIAYRTERNPTKKIELKKAYLKNPDRATALRLTRGEKVVNGIIAGVLPLVGTVAIGAGVGAQMTTRRSIERSQASRAYG